jgi:hypothetical protein
MARWQLRPELGLSGDGWIHADALGQMLSWTDARLTEFELARDRGRGISQTLRARSGGGRPKGRR